MARHFLVAWLALAANFAHAAQPAVIRQAAWLAGCWEAVSPRRVVEEQWLSPRGNSMLGVSRTVRGDSLAGYELVLIREQDGRLAYEAHPSGQPAAVFLSRSASDSSIEFEDLLHEFPQRIGYRLIGPDSLLAWVEGRVEGRLRRIEFPYRRAKCAGL